MYGAFSDKVMRGDIISDNIMSDFCVPDESYIHYLFNMDVDVYFLQWLVVSNLEQSVFLVGKLEVANFFASFDCKSQISHSEGHILRDVT